MTVSSRHILTGAIASFAMIAAGGAAVAASDGSKGGQRVGVPSVSSGYQSRPQKPRPNFQPRVNIPSVNVNAPSVIVNKGNVAVDQRVFNLNAGSAGSTVFFGSNGGFATPSTPVAPSSLDGLAVVGADQTVTETVTRQVPVTEETCAPQVRQTVAVRPVQAVCIDDKGAPHPASRLTAEEAVSETFGGELFRCLAGTHMQVTLGQIVNGSASFAQGETFSCRKGEALVHGQGGNLTCAPAMPQRNCNERSLLRRHGPGIKLIRTASHEQTCVPTQHTTYKTVTQEVQRVVPNENGPIVFDGGVGQGVF